jgi:hypothetical protein
MGVTYPTVQQQSKSEHVPGQSVQAPGIKTSSLDDMCRVVTVIQQIVTEHNGAESEKDKIVAFTKIVANHMK